MAHAQSSGVDRGGRGSGGERGQHERARGDAGAQRGSLGHRNYMFWAAGAPSSRGQGTFPPNTCQNGTGVGATSLNVPIPMPALRQN
jgi:hypothetical protein